MPQATKVININRLRDKVAGRVLIGETEHDVLQFTGGTYDELRNAAPADAITASMAAVAAVVPTLDPAHIRALNLDQLQVLVTMAGAGIEAVEAMFPNVAGPVDEVSTPPA